MLEDITRLLVFHDTHFKLLFVSCFMLHVYMCMCVTGLAWMPDICNNIKYHIRQHRLGHMSRHTNDSTDMIVCSYYVVDIRSLLRST